MSWDPAITAVHVEWKGWADSAEFAALFRAGLEALREHQGSRWLGDCRRQRVIKQSDQDWLVGVWFPEARAAGLRRMAIVNPVSVVATMSRQAMMNMVPVNELEVAYFATVPEAAEWLVRPHTADRR